jgi:hypothetical protein
MSDLLTNHAMNTANTTVRVLHHVDCFNRIAIHDLLRANPNELPSIKYRNMIAQLTSTSTNSSRSDLI